MIKPLLLQQMHTWVAFIITGFTLLNILISIFMTYSSIMLVRKCPCMKRNYHWYIVTTYFLISVLFLAYSLLFVWHLNRGLIFGVVMSAYTLATIIFVTSGYILTTRPDTKCNCKDSHYDNVLFLVTVMRTLMVAVTLVTTLIWVVVWLLSK